MKTKAANFWSVLLFSAIAGIVFLLMPFWEVIVFACITAYFFVPVYDMFAHSKAKKNKRKGLALLLTWIVIVLTLLVPLGGFIWLLYDQALVVGQDLASSAWLQDWEWQKSIDWLNEQLARIPYVEYTISIDNLQEQGAQFLQTVSGSLAKYTLAFGKSLPTLFTNIFLYIVVVSGLMVHRRIIVDTIKHMLPIAPKAVDTYVQRISQMGGSLIKGTFVIAVLQGLVSGGTYWVAGVPYPIFWTLVTIFIALVPLIGAGVVAIPLGIVLLVAGNFWMGMLVIVANILIVSNVDTLLRPYLVSKDAQLPVAWFLLSLFGGLYWFGVMGLLYGPVLMVAILTTIELFIEQQYTDSQK